MRTLATVAMAALAVIVMAVYLPLAYQKLFQGHAEKTHLFYSPVIKDFIYKEKIIGPPPAEAKSKAEDHHANIAYRDGNGTYYSRVEFEKMLPFIYYKNMELWGLLPLHLNGRTLHKTDIKKNRRVLELRPNELPANNPAPPLYPLMESNPGQVRLVFPEDRFRMTSTAMEFVNADYNTIDKGLTQTFTNALKAEGFVFPARSVNGKFTVLKPFDDGAFIVDTDYNVFHVKREDGKPQVVRTPIAPGLKTRFIKISENRQRRIRGLLLAGDGSLHLLRYDGYATQALPLEHYDPDSMDFKMLINPLYKTAVTSNETTIRAVAMDGDCRPLARYEHRMSRADLAETPAAEIFNALFPFSLRLDSSSRSYVTLDARPGGPLSLAGIAICLALCIVITRWRCGRFPRPAALGLVLLTGIYGLITSLILETA